MDLFHRPAFVIADVVFIDHRHRDQHQLFRRRFALQNVITDLNRFRCHHLWILRRSSDKQRVLTLSTVPAQADIIDDTIGKIQQAINDAYNPDRGRDYEDSRDDGWQREVSDDRRRQYDDRRRQFEDRRRQLDDRQRQLDQERRQLEDEERRMEDEYGR